jgi:hypothetical protein
MQKDGNPQAIATKYRVAIYMHLNIKSRGNFSVAEVEHFDLDTRGEEGEGKSFRRQATTN